MRVVITGAAGLIGREVADELSGSHEVCLIDRRPVPDRKSIIADLTQYNANHWYRFLTWPRSPCWWAELIGAEVVIHLAEDPSPEQSWQRVLNNNIQASWNVLHVSAQNRVRRVVYASSGWTVKALEQELAPDCYKQDGVKVGSEAFPRPVTAYGIAKGCIEITGRTLVDEKKLDSFVAVRLGWYHPPNPSKNNHDHHLWDIGTEDLRSLFRRCVEAEFEGFHVVYGVSAQQIAPYDLSYTRRLLSWEPRQVPE